VYYWLHYTAAAIEPHKRTTHKRNFSQGRCVSACGGVLASRWGRRYRDLGAFRLIRKSTLMEMEMQDRGFGWTVEMQVGSPNPAALHTSSTGIPSAPSPCINLTSFDQ
jgi:hypothetical protein